MTYNSNPSLIVVLFPVFLILVGFALIGINYVRGKGYPVGGDNVAVRCRDGNIYTTTWSPLISLKAIKLGALRFQSCPVGNHWSIVYPVKAS